MTRNPGYKLDPVSKRFHVFVGPSGHLSAVGASNARLLERRKGWRKIITVHKPLFDCYIIAAYNWIARHYDV